MKSLLKSLALATTVTFSLTNAYAAGSDFISVPTAQNTEQKQTIHLVETYYDALNQKDMNLFFSIMRPNVIHDINQGSSEKGVEKFKKFMNNANASFNETLSHIVIMVSDDGKYAAAKWIDNGTYYKTTPDMGMAANNQKYTLPGGHFFEIKDGKLSHVTTYYNVTDFMSQMKKQ